MTFDDLVAALRELDSLRDKGKRHPNFHYKSRPFLHFHSGDDGVWADVRFGDDFEPVPLTSPAQRAALLARVKAHVDSAGRRPRL